MSSYGQRYRFGPPGGLSLGPAGPVPDAVKGLLIANGLVYLLQIVVSHVRMIELFGLIPARVAEVEIWRLVTYAFLHGGVWHLALNMLMLWMFGSELEHRWGRKFFLRYYLVCAIGGGLTYVAVRWGSWVPSVGASGAIYGVLMAYAMWFPDRIVLLAFMFPVRVRHVIVFLIAIELLQAIESTGAGIAYAAHLGGMAFGYAYLRWWTKGGVGLGIPGWNEIRRSYRRWRLRRLQRKRFGDKRTLH